MGKFILLVDDEPDIRDVLGASLRKVGFEVKCAGTGQEALRMFLKTYYDRPFDVILLDVGLPDVDGCDVLKTIRQEEEIRGVNYDSGVKIIMQTGKKDPYMEAFNRGCDDYIIKPYSFEDLIKKINEKIETENN
ncbi:MAG: response regulator transcription factor [Candidatus Omnitrophica bacterium]|nr:response regulator transcription factor [Candidatus Omnitrophota bacterium]